jgi:hypothetical protein
MPDRNGWISPALHEHKLTIGGFAVPKKTYDPMVPFILEKTRGDATGGARCATVYMTQCLDDATDVNQHVIYKCRQYFSRISSDFPVQVMQWNG